MSDRYTRDQVLGEGTYGKVYKGTDSQTGEIIALKKTLLDLEREGVPASTLREVVLLKELQHPGIVSLKDVVITESNLFLIFEYLDKDLRSCIESYPDYFTPETIKAFMYQIIKAINTCHSRRILHRDLKPANILVDMEKQIVKIADFGLARAFQIPLRPYTNNVQTPFYRAPELIFEYDTYGTAIDMWSCGCIFAELILRQVFFRGTGELDQIRVVFEKMGFPDEVSWPGVSELPRYSELQSTFGSYSPQNLPSYFPNYDPVAIDLLCQMLTMDPKRRITAKDAELHEYFQELR